MNRPEGLTEAMERLRKRASSDLIKRSTLTSPRMPHDAAVTNQAVDRALARIEDSDTAAKAEALEEVKARLKGMTERYEVLKR